MQPFFTGRFFLYHVCRIARPAARASGFFLIGQVFFQFIREFFAVMKADKSNVELPPAV